jgi:hypothetical protein
MSDIDIYEILAANVPAGYLLTICAKCVDVCVRVLGVLLEVVVALTSNSNDRVTVQDTAIQICLNISLFCTFLVLCHGL